MRYGNRTEAAEFGDPDAMLARFEPGPDRVARVVLHPRLSFVPCAEADFEAFRLTFAVDVSARIFTAEEVDDARNDGGESAERVAAFDEAIEGILSAREQQDAAERPRRRGRRAARRGRRPAWNASPSSARKSTRPWPRRAPGSRCSRAPASPRRSSNSEVADARAAVAGGRGRAAAQRRDHERRRTRDAQGAGRARPAAGASSNGSKAKASAVAYALDEASHQLELWAAQRAFDTRPIRARPAAPAGRQRGREQIVEATRARNASMPRRARLEAAEPHSPSGGRPGCRRIRPPRPTAIRTQIEAVERSLGDAEAAREAEVAKRSSRKRSPPGGDSEAAARQLEHALDRMDTEAGRDQDMDEVLAELRHRREELTAGDRGPLGDRPGPPGPRAGRPGAAASCSSNRRLSRVKT